MGIVEARFNDWSLLMQSLILVLAAIALFMLAGYGESGITSTGLDHGPATHRAHEREVEQKSLSDIMRMFSDPDDGDKPTDK